MEMDRNIYLCTWYMGATSRTRRTKARLTRLSNSLGSGRRAQYAAQQAGSTAFFVFWLWPNVHRAYVMFALGVLFGRLLASGGGQAVKHGGRGEQGGQASQMLDSPVGSTSYRTAGQAWLSATETAGV